jgi:hypothetical protein
MRGMKCLLAFAVLAAACGSKGPSPKPPLPPDLQWKDMNADQRHQFMEDTVLPRTKELFVKFDAATYANMDCKTCHGNGADDGSFEMPDSKIKPLPNTPEAFMAWVAKDARAGKYAEFMSQQLEPLMGQLLHVDVFDPQTGKGDFSCSNCHYLVDESGKAAPDPRHAHDHEGHEHHHEHGDHDEHGHDADHDHDH